MLPLASYYLLLTTYSETGDHTNNRAHPGLLTLYSARSTAAFDSVLVSIELCCLLATRCYISLARPAKKATVTFLAPPTVV